MQKVELVFVPSTMLQAVGYDAESRTLIALFNNDRMYFYRNVPPEIYKELFEADSIGIYMRKNVIGKYPIRPPRWGSRKLRERRSRQTARTK